MRGTAWDGLTEYRRAITDYDEAVRSLLPTWRSCIATARLSYFRIDDDARALADFAEAIRLNPKFNLTYNNRGYLYLTRGQYQLALADLQKSIELDPQHPNAYKNLAWLLATCPEEKYRDGAKAVEHARKALELGGEKNAAWLDVLAAAHAEAGQFPEAVEWEQKAIAAVTDPKDAADFGLAWNCTVKGGPIVKSRQAERLKANTTEERPVRQFSTAFRQMERLGMPHGTIKMEGDTLMAP